MQDIEKFIAGFRSFQETWFGEDAPLFEPLKEGQSPRTMVIACSDSRVDPAILTNCAPGDLFVVRNVANLVPPNEPDTAHHGVSAALQYAAEHLEVQDIVVMGHAHCGGIGALVDGADAADGFIGRWMDLAAPAREKISAELAEKPPELQKRAVEQAAILLSLENLLTFPFIRARVESGQLFLHGWYFDLQAGKLLSYAPHTGKFHEMA